MKHDLEYRAKLKKVIVDSLIKHQIPRTDKKAILKALPKIWSDLEASKLLKPEMNYKGFEEQAMLAYETSQFEELFNSLFGRKR